MACSHRLPRFRATCLTVCVLNVLIGGSILLRGMASMEPFGVPEATLASPHYADAIFWVYSHMVVIGVITGVVGWYAKTAPLQRAFARVMLAAHAYYTFLDVRASDSALGTGLYQGPESVMPAVIAGLMTLMFLHLSLCSESTSGES